MVQLPNLCTCQAIAAACNEGYTVVSVSGGEPLMYRPLAELLEQAHACGALTTVTTNGMLLTERPKPSGSDGRVRWNAL